MDFNSDAFFVVIFPHSKIIKIPVNKALKHGNGKVFQQGMKECEFWILKIVRIGIVHYIRFVGDIISAMFRAYWAIDHSEGLAMLLR